MREGREFSVLEDLQFQASKIEEVTVARINLKHIILGHVIIVPRW
jgi:hypothetical protein